MMLSLAANVFFNSGKLGFTDAKGPVSVLPGEATASSNCLLNPAGGTSFENLQSFAHGSLRRYCKETMYVVFDPTKEQCFKTVSARNSSKIRPDLLLDV